MTNRMKLFGTKLGMSRLSFKDGTSVAVTLVQVPDAYIVGFDHNPKQEADFQSVLVAYQPTEKAKRVAKSIAGQTKKANVPLCKKIAGIKGKKDAEYKVGDIIGLNLLGDGDIVDVQGTTIGKGFAGGMKRHGFGGLRASHGVSVSHRSLGSTGQCQDPGKVFKGKKMPGHMGTLKTTIKHLPVLEIDQENKVVCLKGAVPGKKGGELVLFINEKAGE